MLATIAVRLDAYNYEYAWVSSHFAVMARTFNVIGLFDLGLVPVQNNAPLTDSPDAYLHWPPLYPVLLALLFRFLGEGAVIQHLLSVTLNLVSAALIWRSLADRSSDRTAASLAVLAFLGAPMMFSFGFVGLHLHLAIMLTLLALVLFASNTGAAARGGDASRRQILLSVGAVAYFLAVMTSWEPLLAAPALCFLALLDRHRQTTLALLLLGFAATAALLSIALLYGSEYPHFAERLWNRALLRSGESVALYPPDYTPHDLQDIVLPNPTDTLTTYVWHGILSRLPALGMLGMLGLAGGLACVRAAAEFPRPAIAIYLGSLSMFFLWSILMRNHMGIHEYEMLILLPAAACGVGLSCERFLPFRGASSSEPTGRNENPSLQEARDTIRRRALVCLAAPFLVASSSYATIRDTIGDFTPSNEMIAMAELSKAVLPENAIIATPYSRMEFVYYSGRHVIRAIESEEVLEREQKATAALCATCPVYLVAGNDAVDAFPSYRHTKPLAEISNTGAVWRIGNVLDAGRDRGSADSPKDNLITDIEP
ncbi:hypothetical protein O7A70_28640 [Mesorhizobium sp. Cs1299R1N1]|uniref:ArnT family glycosyltransferase n=1 Tax=Mesorhizobium sp. Cs1299R1N1 TaxID=3015172 RepID=UPI00301BB2E4